MINIDQVSGAGDQSILDYLLRNEKSLIYANPRFIRLVPVHLGAEPGWFVARRKGHFVGILTVPEKVGAARTCVQLACLLRQQRQHYLTCTGSGGQIAVGR